MSDTQTVRWLEGQHEDFDSLLAKEDWAGARAIMQEVGDKGFETEALFLHQSFNRAFYAKPEDDFEYLPYEEVIPVQTEAERLADLMPHEIGPTISQMEWRREGDDKFPTV